MIKIKSLRILIMTLFVLFLNSCTWEEVQVKMQFAPKVGDVYRLNMVMEQKITQTAEGVTTNIDQTMGMGNSLIPTKTDQAGNVWVDIRYEWIKFSQSTPMGKIEYDSRNPSDTVNPIVKGLAGLVGKGYSMKVSPSGEVLEIAGVDALIAELLDYLDANNNEALKAQLEEQFKKMYSEESLKEQSGNMLIEYPKGSVKIGDTWTASAMSNNFAPLRIETTYTLLSFENNIATIGEKSIISSNPESSETDLGIYKIRYNLSGTQEGATKVNTASGWSISSTVNQTVSGEIVMRIDEQETIVPMSIISAIQVDMSEE